MEGERKRYYVPSTSVASLVSKSGGWLTSIRTLKRETRRGGTTWPRCRREDKTSMQSQRCHHHVKFPHPQKILTVFDTQLLLGVDSPVLKLVFYTFYSSCSLAKKAKAIDKPVPLQPMNLILEIKYTPVNNIDSEMENQSKVNNNNVIIGQSMFMLIHIYW